MNDETKILFDAPWTGGMRKDRLSEEYVVVSDHNFTIAAHVDTKENANRLARLPELYDALAESTQYYCGICHNLSGQEEPKTEDLIENGCPKNRTSCVALKCIELLRKVRDGE